MEKFGKCQFMDAEEISSGKQTSIDSPHHSPVTITLIIHHPKFPTVVKVVMCSRGGAEPLQVERHKNIDSMLHTKTTFQAHTHSTSISGTWCRMFLTFTGPQTASITNY